MYVQKIASMEITDVLKKQFTQKVHSLLSISHVTIDHKIHNSCPDTWPSYNSSIPINQTYHSFPSDLRFGGVPTEDTAVGGGLLIRCPLTSCLRSSSIELLGLCTVVAAVVVYFSSSLRVRRHIITAIRITVTTAAPHIPAIRGMFFCRSNGLK